MNLSKKRFSRRTALRGASAGASAVAAAWFVGCSDDDGPGGATPDSTSSPAATSAGSVTATGSPQAGGTLKVAPPWEPTGLDPAVSRGGNDHHWLYSIFDNLVNNDPKFNTAKGIATDWEVVDPLTISFTIDNGFTYQDGTPFSASDIKYTIERHQDPATKSYAAGQVESIDKVEVVDDSHVVFHLKSVTASLFAILGDRAGMIMSPTSVEKAGADFTNHPVGSGPMAFDNWTSGASLKLSKFGKYRVPNYPHLDGIDFQVVPNSSVQLANLRTGNADLIFVSSKDAKSVKADDKVQYHEWVSTGYTQVNMNLSQPPLTDMRVRQAMTYALNRKAILEGIFFGVDEIANGPITRASWAFNADLKPIEEDLKKAKDLLSAAGHPDGLSWEMVITPSEENTPLAEMLKSQWARVGIDITLVSRDSTAAGAEYRAQKYPMFLVGFSGRADPDMTIYENFHSKGGFNRATFNTEWVPDDDQKDLDAKIEKARAIYDQDERKAMYDDIQSQIVLNAHGIFFTHQKSIIGTSKRVQDFTPYGDGKLRLHELWLKA